MRLGLNDWSPNGKERLQADRSDWVKSLQACNCEPNYKGCETWRLGLDDWSKSE